MHHDSCHEFTIYCFKKIVEFELWLYKSLSLTYFSVLLPIRIIILFFKKNIPCAWLIISWIKYSSKFNYLFKIQTRYSKHKRLLYKSLSLTYFESAQQWLGQNSSPATSSRLLCKINPSWGVGGRLGSLFNGMTATTPFFPNKVTRSWLVAWLQIEEKNLANALPTISFLSHSFILFPRSKLKPADELVSGIKVLRVYSRSLVPSVTIRWQVASLQTDPSFRCRWVGSIKFCTRMLYNALNEALRNSATKLYNENTLHLNGEQSFGTNQSMF